MFNFEVKSPCFYKFKYQLGLTAVHVSDLRYLRFKMTNVFKVVDNDKLIIDSRVA